MNRPLLVVLLVVVVGSCVQSHPGGGGHHGRESCWRALAPTRAEVMQLRAATITCIEETGLQAIIDGLRGGGRRLDVAALLEANGYATEATTLRTCLVMEMGMLNADGTFDLVTLKATLLVKVTGTSLQANTQLGLDGCPAVEEFDVPEYLQCVMTYCRTGVAP